MSKQAKTKVTKLPDIDLWVEDGVVYKYQPGWFHGRKGVLGQLAGAHAEMHRTAARDMKTYQQYAGVPESRKYTGTEHQEDWRLEVRFTDGTLYTVDYRNLRGRMAMAVRAEQQCHVFNALADSLKNSQPTVGTGSWQSPAGTWTPDSGVKLGWQDSQPRAAGLTGMRKQDTVRIWKQQIGGSYCCPKCGATEQQHREFSNRRINGREVAAYTAWDRCGVDGTRYIRVARLSLSWSPQAGDPVRVPGYGVTGWVARIHEELIEVSVAGQLITQSVTAVDPVLVANSGQEPDPA